MTQAEPFEQALLWATDACSRLRAAIGQVVVGQADVVEQTLWTLVAGGHLLLEGVPGLGKTLLVRTLADCLDLRFSRIQFTPDLMPSDVTGTTMLALDEGADPRQQRRFTLHRGPIFGNVILADEINRATPKTQSSLLEAMQERAVTIGGARHPIEEPFFVFATENPIEMEGTYPLPEAQLDRFLLKVLVPAPTEDEVVEVLARTTAQSAKGPQKVLGRPDVLRLMALCRDVTVAEPVMRYAARLVGASDPTSPSSVPLARKALRYGAGVRGAQSLVLAAKARALLAGRPQASFSDVEAAAKPALRHRLLRSFEGEADGITTDAVIEAIVSAVPARPERVEAALAQGQPRGPAQT